MLDVCGLTFAPRRLRLHVGVAALFDDARDVHTEVLSDLIQRRRATSVFDAVVQQCRDGLLLGPTVVDDQARYGQQVPEVRDVTALADLVVVLQFGVHERFGELAGQFGCRGLLTHVDSPPLLPDHSRRGG